MQMSRLIKEGWGVGGWGGVEGGGAGLLPVGGVGGERGELNKDVSRPDRGDVGGERLGRRG